MGTRKTQAGRQAGVRGQHGGPVAGAGAEVLDAGRRRPNLQYRVLQFASAEARYAAALRLARDTPGAGIVHVDSMATAERLCRQLRDAGDSACSYHGRLPPATRRLRLRQFRQGARRVMVATPAFGGGMDRHDIRFVIHLRPPASLQAYYRESGRAGRDGLPAQCSLLALPHCGHGAPAPLAAYLQGGACRWQLLLDGLGAGAVGWDSCGQCDHCQGQGAARPALDMAALLTVAGERIAIEFPEDSCKTFMAVFLEARSG
jgi:ATP-dependent DNA helicase RecQ